MGRWWTTCIGLAFGAMLALVACGTAVPKGAYKMDTSIPEHRRVAQTLYRAGVAAGEKASQFRVRMIRSPEVNAANAGAGVFYFTDGLAAQPQEVIDAVVSHEVAHEALGHVGTSIAISVAISAAFAVLDAYAPGAGYGNELVNPLIVRAFSRTQELAADKKAVEILGRMGYRDARDTMLNALRLLKNRYGATGGGLFATHPAIDDRIAEVASLGPSSPAVQPALPATPERRSMPAVATITPIRDMGIDVSAGGRVAVLTRKGDLTRGVLESIEPGRYLIRTVDGVSVVEEADIVEFRSYPSPVTTEQSERSSCVLTKLVRPDETEALGCLERGHGEMYKLILTHDQSVLFIHPSRIRALSETH